MKRRILAAIALGSIAASATASAQLAPPPPIGPTATPPGSPSSPSPSQGLTPPPPVDPTAPGSPTGPGPLSTREQLDRSEAEDNHRVFEFMWIDVLPVSLSYANLTALSNDAFGLKETGSVGPEFGLGAGVRFVTLSFGARARYHALPNYSVWRLNGEVGFRFPMNRFDLFLLAHGGYAFLGTVTKDALEERQAASADSVSAKGFNAGLDLGFDYFLSPHVTLGFGATADALFLYRDQVALPGNLLPATAAVLQNDALYTGKGSAVGITTSAMLRLGFHFGI